MYIPNVPVGPHNPENYQAAHNAVANAIGKSLPPISERQCVTCGLPAAVYHHEAYDPANWLNVHPMCGSCHRLLHTVGAHRLPSERIAIQQSDFATLVRKHALGLLSNRPGVSDQWLESARLELQRLREHFKDVI